MITEPISFAKWKMLRSANYLANVTLFCSTSGYYKCYKIIRNFKRNNAKEHKLQHTINDLLHFCSYPRPRSPTPIYNKFISDPSPTYTRERYLMRINEFFYSLLLKLHTRFVLMLILLLHSYGVHLTLTCTPTPICRENNRLERPFRLKIKFINTSP